MNDSVESPACVETRRWGARWCDTHEQRATFCEQAAANAPTPDGHDMTLEAGGYAVWLACTCGVTGPRRTGTAEDAHTQAAADRATHATGRTLQEAAPVLDLDIPTAKELLNA